MKMNFGKLYNLSNALRAIRKNKSLSLPQKIAIRDNLTLIEDLILGNNTKISFLNEEFSDMKNHKEYLESAEKMTKLIKQRQLEVKNIFDHEYDANLKFNLVDIDSEALCNDVIVDEQGRTIKIGEAHYELFLEYYGVIFTDKKINPAEIFAGSGLV